MAYAKNNQSGQTLVVLLFFIMVGITITVAAMIILSANSLAAAKIQQGEIARQEAEAGAENAYVKLLRDPGYTGETLQIGEDSVVISVSGSTTKTIDSTATSEGFVRKVEITASYVNNVLTPISWGEVF